MKRLALGQLWAAVYKDFGERKTRFTFKIIAIKKCHRFLSEPFRHERYNVYLGLKLNHPDIEPGRDDGALFWFDQDGNTDGTFTLTRKKKEYWAEDDFIFIDEQPKTAP